MNSAEADAFLYRGDLLRVVELSADADANRMVFDESMPRQRAEAAVSSRLVLRAATLLEGWAVSLARWTLEAWSRWVYQANLCDDISLVGDGANQFHHALRLRRGPSPPT